MILSIIFKAGRFLYRKLNLSSNQQLKKPYKGAILNPEKSNLMIMEAIYKGNPFMISRLGTPEARCIMNYLDLAMREKKGLFNQMDAEFKSAANTWSDSVKTDLRDLVGFFPVTDDMLEKFALFYKECIKQTDAIGVWGFVPGETYLIEHYCPLAITYDPMALEPYFFDNPWSQALAGKKVLVIHPFSESIKKQLKQRKLLFANSKILPEFECTTIKAVQSIAGNKTEFENWFAALEYMQHQIDNADFDVALIGAGSYGLPLSAYVKQKGKIAIHIGGATQILFGIKGKRWDDHPQISSFYNDHWVRPEQSELVPDAQKVEGGCYW